MTAVPQRSFDQLKGEIARRHDALSGRLRQIAEYVLRHPNEVALGTVSALAGKIGVQPSAIVRFANTLGYSGFTALQRVFRERLVSAATPSYRERIESLRVDAGRRQRHPVSGILARFIEDDISALDALFRSVPEKDLDRAVELLARARTIYVLAQGRSFPVAYYLDHALSRLEVPSRLFDGVGGLVPQRARVATRHDALLLVSFRDYSPESLQVGKDLSARGVPVVAITDTALSPIARFASVTFEVGDSSERLFRSLAAPLCLAQALVVALGHRLAARPGSGT